METTKIVAANGVYDLSHVTTLKDLKDEIGFLQASIKKDEKELEEHFHKMPQEALKATADAVLPAFINRMIANRSWKILTSGAGLLANPFQSKVGFTKNILGSAKKLGLVAIMKGAYNMWRSKNNSNKKPVVKMKPSTISAVKVK